MHDGITENEIKLSVLRATQKFSEKVVKRLEQDFAIVSCNRVEGTIGSTSVFNIGIDGFKTEVHMELWEHLRRMNKTTLNFEDFLVDTIIRRYCQEA